MISFAAIAIVLLILGGCSPTGSSSAGMQEDSGGSHRVERGAVPDSPPNITGIVTEIREAPGGETSSKRILVEESPKGCFKSASNEGCDKLYLNVTGKTGIFRQVQGNQGTFAKVQVANLQRGQKVHAWHTGVLKKSYPGQGYARVIVIDVT